VNEQEHARHEAGDEKEACGNQKNAESGIFSGHIYSVTLLMRLIAEQVF